MGSCSEDCKVEGESVTLGDEDGDRSLEVESKDNEAKQVDLASGKEFVEEVVSLNGIYRGVNIGDGCVELVIGVKEAETKSIGVMGAEEENGHLELEKAADLSVLKSDFEGFDRCSHLNLRGELEANEYKQVNLEREDGERERESGHLELGKGFVDEVGSLINKDSGCETGKGCGELVVKESGHLGLGHDLDVSVSKKDFEGFEVEACPTPDMGDIINDINGGVHCNDSENEQRKLVSKVHEDEEQGQEILMVVEENMHLGLEQTVKVDILWKDFNHCEMQPSSANGDAPDPSNVASVDSGINLKDLAFEKKADDVNCSGHAGCEKENELIGLALKLEVNAVERVLEKSGSFGRSSSENIDESKDCNNGASVHTLEVMNNAVSLGTSSGYGESASGKKEVENECLEDFGSDEEIKHIGLQRDSKSVSDQEHDEFPGLSPLRTLGGGEFACSVLGMGSQVGLLSSGVLDSDGIRNECEDAEILVSSGLAADRPLLRIDKDASTAADGHCCPRDDSRDFEASCMVERCGKLCSFGNEKVDFGHYNEVDNIGRSDSKSNPILVFRRSNPKRSASLRSNLADGKYNQSSAGNNRRNGKKAVHIIPTFLLRTIKISDKLKRKRSSHRLARQSLWGPVENLINIFEQTSRFVGHDADKIHVRNKRSKKRMPIGSSKKQAKTQKDGNICASSGNHSATYDKVEVKHKWAGDNFPFTVESLPLGRQLVDKDVESSLTQEASVELGELPGVSSQIDPEMFVETVSDRSFLDPGTSPDSDIYHPVMDDATRTNEVAIIMTNDSDRTTSTIQFSETCQNMHVLGTVSEDGLHSSAATSTETLATSLLVPPPHPNLCAKPKKGERSGKHGEQTIVEKLHGPDNQNNTKLSNCGKAKHKTEAAINKKNSICSKSIKKTSRKGSKDKSFPRRSYILETTNLEHIDESVKGQDSLEKYVLPAEDFINTWKGHDLSSGTKPCKGITDCRETTRQKRDNAHAKMGKGVQKFDNRCSTEERTQTVDASVDASDYMSLSSGALNPALTMSTEQNCKSNASNRAVLNDVSSLVMTSAGDQLIPNDSKTGMEQPLPPQVAWVLCDDCEKWRCISAELANTLEETKCKWTCKDNTDKAFSDCSIPQEKTNAEINAELGILDEDPSSVEANANGDEPLKLASKRTSWIPIKSNVFLHRNRKTQTIDEIMVCHCKRPRDGRRGCGDQCLNRMLNIECAKGTCPCGDLCSNQRFQKRKYAKFEWLRCGKKGYGLQLQEDAPQGQFLIEYVGEVLDLATYDARQRCYASQGQKHFYFMTLNGGEVIDACAKGNLGRFINHSCEPNCRTEKWMVNGEVCIGLFAIRDIKKGEEVTFDYNYVRVVGAAAKKCICGSSECRGYLGGDPLNSEIIVQSDSDEEDSEQVMMNKKGQREFDSISNANDVKISKNKENLLEREEKVIMQPPATPEYEVCAQNEGAVCRARSEVNPLDNCLRNLDPRQAEDIISRPDTQPDGDSEQSLNSAPIEESVFKRILDIQPQDISVEASTSMTAVLLDSVLNKQKAVTDFSADKPNISKPHSLLKSSYSRGTIKRRRSNVKNMVSAKPKTFAAVVGSGHLNSVESKLNELLEMDGGISKQKDATSGYLRLLFVTAAEGDVGGCASQSTRDLSLILDAILKTKSRKVLVDIINTNGLQMLHNIMKQNRGDFNRIPILRKLLKVLEFLALTEILTPELINKDPPYNGMESFKESILKLANHGDKQVHKIARGFRDKWIPRNIKRIEPSDRDSVQLDRQIPHHNCCIQSSIVKCQQVDAARGTDAIVIVGTADHQRSASSSELDNPGGTSALSVTDDNRSASGTKTCKRKSRWDHPSDFTTTDPPDHSFEEPGPKFPKCTPDLHNVADANSSQDLMQLDCDDGRPPGFFEDDDGLPPGFQNNHQAQNSPSTLTAVVTGEEFVMGHPQKIYLSRMTMSYGIPVAVLQQLGAPATGENLHQRGNQNWAIAPGMPFHPFPPLPSYPRKPVRQQIDTGVGLPGPSDMSETITGSRNSEFGGRRLRFPSNRGHGSRFPHPQRWDNSNNKRRRFQSCWPHGPNQCLGRGGFRGGSNIRNGVRNVRGNFGRSYVLQML